MKRLYVLVNPKLNTVYGCVQGGHAVAQFLLEHPEQDWDNQFLIYLHADPYAWIKPLRKKGVDFSVFREPDLGNAITALACQDDTGELFKELRTVK